MLAAVGFVAAQSTTTPRFTIHSKEGRLPPALVNRLGDAWSLEIPGNKTLGAADWIGLAQDGKQRPAPATEHFVLLATRDHLPIKTGTKPSLQEGRIVFTPAAPLRPREGEELSIFAPYVAALWLTAPDGVDEPAVFLAKLQRESRDADLVLLRSGDRVEGTVTAISPKSGCEVQADGRTVVTPWPKIAGVVFATSNLARPRPKKTHALAVLTGGARVHLASLGYDGTEWSGRMTTGADIAIPTSGLLALDLLGGQAMYLSDLKPPKHEQTPYLGIPWPIGVDAALGGEPLRVGDEVHDKGIALHGPCRVTYRLGGPYRWFEAIVALDPAAAAKGRARVSVLVDKKAYPLGDGKELVRGDAPLPVRLDVRDAQELTLVVDVGSFGDVGCRVHWGGARLVK